MTGNGTRPPPTPNAEAPPPGPGQASSLAPSSTTVESSTEGAPPPGPAPPPAASHPRVIRISHQSVEPVVMMHMNIQGELGTVAGGEEQCDGGGGLGAEAQGNRGGEGRGQGGWWLQRDQPQLSQLACVGRGRKNCWSLKSCLRGEGSASSLSGWSERQAFWSGEWRPEALWSQEDAVRPWPRLSQGHSLSPSQILAHSPVEFRAPPLAP